MQTTNIIRQKLETGEPTLSTHIHSTWPSAIEAVGHTGHYDYVEFVAEYGPFDLHDLDNMCRAAELHNLGMMIKVDQSHQAFLAQRGVGSGFDSVLYTDCRSVEDVQVKSGGTWREVHKGDVYRFQFDLNSNNAGTSAKTVNTRWMECTGSNIDDLQTGSYNTISADSYTFDLDTALSYSGYNTQGGADVYGVVYCCYIIMFNSV